MTRSHGESREGGPDAAATIKRLAVTPSEHETAVGWSARGLAMLSKGGDGAGVEWELADAGAALGRLARDAGEWGVVVELDSVLSPGQAERFGDTAAGAENSAISGAINERPRASSSAAASSRSSSASAMLITVLRGSGGGGRVMRGGRLST